MRAHLPIFVYGSKSDHCAGDQAINDSGEQVLGGDLCGRRTSKDGVSQYKRSTFASSSHRPATF
jgi:hypothetical protein